MGLSTMVSSLQEHIRFGELLRLVLSVILLVSAAQPVGASDIHRKVKVESKSLEESEKNRPPLNFYGDRKRGWFWFEDPPEKEEEKPIEKLAPPQTQMVTPDNPVITPEEKQTTEVENVPVEVLWDMHPDDFQALLTKQMKKAVQYPTESNVALYYRTQDIARRKALAFTNTAMLVVQKDPSNLGLNQVTPTSVPGNLVKTLNSQEEVQSVVAQARNDHALLFFVQPGCSYCEKQTEILVYFAKKYGWEIKPIDITVDKNLALRFNIETTPTIMLIKKGEEAYMPISVGVETLSHVEEKIYRAVRYLRGETSGENFTTHESEDGSNIDPRSILERQ